MSMVYPLQVIISSDHNFAEAYNSHVNSVVYASKCITPTEAEEYLDQGVNFDRVIIANGEGESLLPKMGDVNNWNDDFMPRISRVNFAEGSPEAVTQIHSELVNSVFEQGMG